MLTMRAKMHLRHCEVKFLVEPDVDEEAEVAVGASSVPAHHHHREDGNDGEIRRR